MNILFYDVTSPTMTTPDELQSHPVRGTESTFLRITQALSHLHRVTVAHHLVDQPRQVGAARYVSLQEAESLSPDAVVLLRDFDYLERISTTFPQAKHFLWLHNLPPRNLHTRSRFLAKHHWEIIGVSQYHKKRLEQRLKGKWYHNILHQQHIPVHVAYNPLASELSVDATPIKANQMMFTSTPYKGLKQVLTQFDMLRHHFPEYELLVASPNTDDSISLPQNARWISPQSPLALAEHVRESFCVFYPQTERLETFGLVYAEANAVGTPVLAHDFGAASEVLSDPCQLINGNNAAEILEKITAWRSHRPQLQANPTFHLDTVIDAWNKILN